MEGVGATDDLLLTYQHQRTAENVEGRYGRGLSVPLPGCPNLVQTPPCGTGAFAAMLLHLVIELLCDSSGDSACTPSSPARCPSLLP